MSQFRKENRQDDAVVGEYTYTDPFGHVRTVKYTADKLHGFRAEIYIDGKLEQPHIPQAPKETTHVPQAPKQVSHAQPAPKQVLHNHHTHQSHNADSGEEEEEDDRQHGSSHDDISEGYEDSNEYNNNSDY